MSHRPNLIQRLLRALNAEKSAPVPANPSPKSIETAPKLHNAVPTRTAKYQIGQVVRHRIFDFRGVVFDVDPVFSNSDEWYDAIPEEVRPAKDQPYYHLFAENERTHYVAYVSEQNLVADNSDSLVAHPDIAKMFELTDHGYVLKSGQSN